MLLSRAPTPLSLVLPLKSCPLVLSATSEGKRCVRKVHFALLDLPPHALILQRWNWNRYLIIRSARRLCQSRARARLFHRASSHLPIQPALPSARSSMIRMLPLPSCWRRKGRGGLTTSIQIGAILRPWRTAQNLAYSARSQRAKFQTLSRVLAVQNPLPELTSRITQLDLAGRSRCKGRSPTEERARTHRRRARRRWL